MAAPKQPGLLDAGLGMLCSFSGQGADYLDELRVAYEAHASVRAFVADCGSALAEEAASAEVRGSSARCLAARGRQRAALPGSAGRPPRCASLAPLRFVPPLALAATRCRLPFLPLLLLLTKSCRRLCSGCTGAGWTWWSG